MRRLNVAVVFVAVGCSGPTVDGSCTVDDHGDGTATLTCPDGTTAELGVQAASEDTDVSVDTDAEVTGCGPVTVVHGDYVVHNDVDLSLLRCVTEITGSLRIDNTGVPNLSDLASLTAIGGDLAVTFNTAVTSLTGLNALTQVGGSVNIIGNAGLRSLSGMNAVRHIGGDLSIGNYLFGSGGLTSTSGLDALTAVDGSVSIFPDGSFTSLAGLDALATIGQDLWISKNSLGTPSALTSLSSLAALNTLGGDLYINGQGSLCQSEVDALALRVGADCGQSVSDTDGDFTTCIGKDGC